MGTVSEALLDGLFYLQVCLEYPDTRVAADTVPSIPRHSLASNCKVTKEYLRILKSEASLQSEAPSLAKHS